MYGLTRKQMSMCSDLYADEDGYWAILKTGYKAVNYFSETTIHEDTVKEFKEAFKCVKEDNNG